MIEVKEITNIYQTIWLIKGTDTLHREDGPAIEWDGGTKEWWINGKRHREDGPAVIYWHGLKEWCLNNNLYTKEEWFNNLTEEQQAKALYSEFFIKG
jgi:hypothetical protein